MTREAKRAAKMEKKLKILTGGYQVLILFLMNSKLIVSWQSHCITLCMYFNCVNFYSDKDLGVGCNTLSLVNGC